MTSNKNRNPLSPQLITVGFVGALCISVLLMIGTATYLFLFMRQTNEAMERSITSALQSTNADVSATDNTDASPRGELHVVLAASLATAGILCNSCGLFMGIALAFLGLALFLLGIRGEIDVDVSDETFGVKVARMSPGAFAVLCSAIVIVSCIVNKPQVVLSPERSEVQTGYSPPA